MIVDMVGEVAAGIGEIDTALLHHDTGNVPVVAAATIMTVDTTVETGVTIEVVVAMTDMTVSHTMTAMTDMIGLMTSTSVMRGLDPGHILHVG